MVLIFCEIMSALPHIPSKVTNTVASIIQKFAQIPYLLGDVKVISRTMIPNNCVVKHVIWN